VNNAQMAACFNEWMRRFTDDPHGFQAEFQTVNQYLTDLANGVEPSYGEVCAVFMTKLAEQVPAQ
jgi:hypothetical protein